MLRTVQFDNESGSSAIEIYDIIINHFLSKKPNRICPKKIIPKMLFFAGHIPTERLRAGS